MERLKLAGAGRRLPDAARAAAVRQRRCRCTAGRKPVAEPEIAVRMARDLGRRRDRRTARWPRSRRSSRRSSSPTSIRRRRRTISTSCSQATSISATSCCAAIRAPAAATAGLTSRVIRRGAEAARTDRPGSAHRQAARHRRACRQYARRLRRETLGRRRHHHRFDHAAADDRARRDRVRPRARPDRRGVGEFFAAIKLRSAADRRHRRK